MNEETLFHLAVGKPAGERAAFLEHACGGDAALRSRVEALLQAHDHPGSFLGNPAPDLEATSDSLPGRRDGAAGAEGPGSRIGPYKLLQQIGEGGFGVVYMAEQSQPVQRRVALKIIKPGMDSRQVIARFEVERQALALMDHPNIAKVLDANATESGRPYFVMELVKGVPLTTYCDEHRLTVRQRLELLVPVCQAVQHAHQKGIIHRDLKPSNVLVALYDGTPVPKVIDFGVAKATGPKLTERTLFTEFGAVVGTLEYMSPEQAELNQLDIDTRSDIYSLGVLLYELLTGTTPLERKRVKESALLEVLRLIREEEPPRPSTRLSKTQELPAIAASRGLEPKKLSGLVRGELDWIVMKCLEKDRNRRYDTANSLAADLGRYLRDEPVLACPPSAWYRCRKFARRHKAPLVTAVTLVVALAAGTVLVWRERQEAVRQRDEAQANFHKARQAVDRYFTLVSESTLLNEPALEPLRKQLLREALRYYEGFVQERGEDPELQAELVAAYFRITILSYDLGPEEDWLPPFEKGVAVMEDLLHRQPDLAALQSLQAGFRWINTENTFHIRRPDDALRAFVKARTLWEGLVRAHPTVPGFQSDLAAFHLVIAVLHELAGQPAEAVRSYQEACGLWRRLIQANPGVAHFRPALAIGQTNLGHQLAVLGRLPQAEESCRAGLETARRLVADFPGVRAYQELLTGYVEERFGFLLEHAGRLREAEAAYRRVLAGQESLMRDHPTVDRYRKGMFRAWLWLGELCWATGRPAEAAEAYRQARAHGDRLNPADPQAQDQLAWFLATCPDSHFRDARRAVAVARQVVERVPENAGYWSTLGAAHYAAGDYRAAVRALDKATQSRYDQGSVARFLLALAHGRLGERERARRWYDQAVALMEGTELRFIETLRIRAEAERLLGIGQNEND
jgi:serine/threonine protein kinase